MGRTDFFVDFLTSQKNSHSLLIPACLKKKRNVEGRLIKCFIQNLSSWQEKEGRTTQSIKAEERSFQVPCCSQTSFVPIPEPGTAKGKGCTAGGGTESRPNYLSLTPCVLILASCSLGSLDAQTFPPYAS